MCIPAIFLFGFKDFNSPIPDLENRTFYCNHCHNKSVKVIKRRLWFTLFFVPIIPIWFGKRLNCDICSNHVDISKQDVEDIRNGKEFQI